MKKLSTLIAIILIATIGGVYATWNYAGTTKDIGVQENKTVTLENAVLDGAAGTYTLTHNIASINITPNNQEDKLATIVATYTSGDKPVFTLTFDAAPNAGVIRDEALASYVYFGTERDFSWDWGEEITDTNLFVFANGKTSPMTINVYDEDNAQEPAWNKVQEGKFTCEITFNSITDIINFAHDLYLPEINDYNALLSLFGTHNIALHMHLSNIDPRA